MYVKILPLLALQIACAVLFQPTTSSEPITGDVSRTTQTISANMLNSAPHAVIRRRRGCCFVNTCEEVPLGIDDHSTFKCYKKYVCGRKCDQNQGEGVSNFLEDNHVPEFRRRNFIDKYICRHDQCISYKFDCHTCPDPRRKLFNILELSKNCVNCYY